MAKAYLGKISALVTANTSDFNAKLNASAKEVRSFAASMQSSLSRAQTEATASLRGIYTESQKVSRALQAVATQRLSFKGFDNSSITSIKQAVDQFKALQNASVAVNQPLAGAARTLERLSASVQRSFDPALKSAQKSAEYLSAALNRGGIIGEKSFDRIQKKAIAAAEAADRLAEASQLASVGPRGNELAFAAPRVRDALVASADVRQRAANAPASALESGAVANDVQKLVAIDNLIQKRRAEIESGTALKIDTTQARASLENLLSVAERVRGNVTAAIGSTSTTRPGAASRDLGLFGSQVAPSAEQAIARAREVSAEFARLPEAAQAGLRGLAGIASNVANGVQAGTSNAAQLLAVLARLSSGITQATAASREFTLVQSQPQPSGLGLFGSQVAPSAEQAIARAREVSAEFAKLPESAQAGLRGLAGIVSNVADGVQAGTSNADQLTSVLNQLEQRMNGLGNPTGTFGPTLPPGFGGSSDAGIGAPLDAASRQLDQFRSGIVSAKSQLDSMPASVRSQFIPAVQAAEAEFIRLVALGPRATAEEIENATRDMDALTAAVRRTTQAAQVQGFGDFINSANVRQSIGELQGLQRVLIQIGAVAGGPAALAYEAYRARLQEAIQTGTTGLPAVRRELVALQRAAADAAAATGRISAGNAFRQIQRAGDVARGGVDRFSLALNQAAFAVDDFFSSTGGFEQKLRAVSNNVTQLAFVLGGTRGLFIGLGAVIGGQVIVAISKWINEGRTAEDQTKALNDALARQKSLVEELAQAFRSLGDSLTRDAFSPAAREANDFRKELNEIIKKQKELREARVADIDPTVQRERATQGALQRRLESETDIGRRIALQQQLEESKRRERAAAAAANSRQVSSDDVRSALERAIGNVAVAQLPTAVDPASAGRRAIEAERLRRQAAEQAARASAGSVQQQRDAVQAEIDRLAPIAANNDALGFGTSSAARDAIRQLSEILALLEAPVRKAGDALVISVLEGAKKVSDALSQAQSSIANAAFGPSQISTKADSVGRQLESLARQLETATDPKTIEALRAQQQELLRQSTALRSAASSVERFAAVIDKVAKQLSDTVLQDVEGRAGQARREANAARGAVDAGVANVPAFNRPRVASDQRRRQDEAEADRRRLEADVQRAQSGQQEFERRRRQAVQRVESRAAGGTLGQEAQQLIQERDKAQAVLDSDTATVKERQQAADTLARVNARLDQLFQNSTLGQALADFADGLDAASQAAAELDRQIRDQRASADRGRELTLTPGERAAEELNQQIADIREYATRAVEESSGLPEDVAKIRGRMNDAIQRAEEAMIRQVAPTITGMADAVRNSVALGPSRAALTASDATTTQGQQELNRLLRGDDANKNADLVSLQREANELLRAIERKENPVAV